MVDYSKEDVKNLNKKLMAVDTEIRKSKIELNLLGKFFIDFEGI